MVYEKDVPIGESIVSLDILDTAGNVSTVAGRFRFDPLIEYIDYILKCFLFKCEQEK